MTSKSRGPSRPSLDKLGIGYLITQPRGGQGDRGSSRGVLCWPSSRYTRAVPRRNHVDERWLALALVLLPGCEGELAALFSLAFGTALGAWMVSRDRQNRALYAAESLRRAIATGQQREIEMNLRKQLAL